MQYIKNINLYLCSSIHVMICEFTSSKTDSSVLPRTVSPWLAPLTQRTAVGHCINFITFSNSFWKKRYPACFVVIRKHTENRLLINKIMIQILNVEQEKLKDHYFPVIIPDPSIITCSHMLSAVPETKSTGVRDSAQRSWLLWMCACVCPGGCSGNDKHKRPWTASSCSAHMTRPTATAARAPIERPRNMQLYKFTPFTEIKILRLLIFQFLFLKKIWERPTSQENTVWCIPLMGF